MSNFRTSIYKKAIKPLLFKISPDTIHEQMTVVAFGVGKTPLAPSAIRAVMARRHPELETTWKGMKFASPIGLSAGFDKNGKTMPVMHAIGFGFGTVGSVTSQPCAGNPRPWFYRLPKTESLVVHAGLVNDGVDRVLGRLSTLPKNLSKRFPIVLSVARTNSEDASGVEEGIDDYVASIQAAKDSPAVSMFEINISCPNAYGGETYTSPELLGELLTAIDALKVSQPITLKMPADLGWKEFSALLDVAVQHNVAGVTLANLTKDRSKVDFKEELPDSVQGGLSGAPTRKLSNELIRRTYAAYGDTLMIIGVGGVLTAEDAYEKIRLGAQYVELITGLIFNGPGFIEEINQELVRYLKRDGFTHISQAVGSAHKKAAV